MPIAELLTQIKKATGRDPAIDRRIADALDGGDLGQTVPDYTASVERCVELIRRTLPGWHWHVGYGATGIMPYAMVSEGTRRYEATAATVPVALLDVMLQALVAVSDDPLAVGATNAHDP
jgi:signal transduction histidine kinase